MSLTCPHLALITGHPGAIGGMEKFARFLVHIVLSAGGRVTVALSGENIFAPVGLAFGHALSVERVNWIDVNFTGDRGAGLATVLARRRWFRQIRPDVAVFVQSSNTPFRASVAGAALAGVPIIITHRTMPYVIPPVAPRRHVFGLLPGLGLYRRKMVAKTRLIAALATRIVYNSEQVRCEYQRDYGYPAAKGVVIPNALEMPLAAPQLASTEPASRPLTIGYVGRLAREKKLDVLLRAVAALRSQPPARLALWGEGAQRPILEILAAELGIADRTTWHGHTDDVASAYRQCDLVVLCSPRESSSNMILEAMAAGRAVVVTSVGGQPELVEHGRCGVIVPPADPAALAHALDNLIANPAARLELGQKARESVGTRHDPQAIAGLWLETLSEAAGRGRAFGKKPSDNTVWSEHLVPVDMPHL